MMTLNYAEMKVLAYLLEHTSVPEQYSPFAPIMEETGLDRRAVRRACRRLARHGLAQYEKGLCDWDGNFRGAGYAITAKGMRP
jgi:DNA-binding MarR family transcriptional regulator